jgi:hypothetical protein
VRRCLGEPLVEGSGGREPVDTPAGLRPKPEFLIADAALEFLRL